MNSRIILYSTGCAKCTVLKKKLELKGIEFEINRDEELMKTELVEKRGFKFLPVLQINDDYLDFKQALEWLEKQ